MKVVILAGGLGSRISEETHLRPKPMVEIGGHPILWHIMMIYSHFGLRDFIICLGYKGYFIKEYFANFVLHRSDITVDLGSGSITYGRGVDVPDWRVTLVDTGAETMTGGRLKRIGHLLDPVEPFCATYGDGLADVDIKALVEQRKREELEKLEKAEEAGRKLGINFNTGPRRTKTGDETGTIDSGALVVTPDDDSKPDNNPPKPNQRDDDPPKPQNRPAATENPVRRNETPAEKPKPQPEGAKKKGKKGDDDN